MKSKNPFLVYTIIWFIKVIISPSLSAWKTIARLDLLWFFSVRQTNQQTLISPGGHNRKLFQWRGQQSFNSCSADVSWEISWDIFNSLSHGECGFDLYCVILKCIVVITFMRIPSAIAFGWMAEDPTDGKSTMVQVMAWCSQASAQ